MTLSESQAKSVIESPQSRQTIDDARAYESRLRIFTQSMTLDELRNEDGWTYFMRELRDTLTDKKAERISQFISYPLSIVDISDNILTEAAKVFDSKNAFFSISSTNEQRDDYLKSTIGQMGLYTWIRDHGMDVLNNKANSCVVIDFNVKGEPYLIFIGLDRLHDFNLKNKVGELGYISFQHSTDGSDVLYAVYDDSTYWVFRALGGDRTKLDLVSSKPNLSGRCPGRMFLSESLNGGFNRRIPISTSLSKMSEWQRFDIFKTYADYYYPFPVIERVRENCTIDGCVDGKILVGNQEYIEDGMSLNRPIYDSCPSCAERSDIVGPGLVIELQPRGQKDDPDYAGNFRMINPEVSSLKYIKEKLQDLTDGIIYNSVGYNELLNSEAVNETQIQGSLESKTNVLLRMKTNFDTLHKWIVSQIVLGTYGDMTDVSINVSYGTEFYVYTEAEIQKVFDDAKKSKLPESEIAEVYLQLIDTKYKGNPDKIERALMLYNLDPLPFDEWKDVKEKYEMGLLQDSEFLLKANFTNLVAKFERENTTVTKFGVNLPLNKRIDRILETIKTYNNGEIRKVEQPTGETGGQQGRGQGVPTS